MDTEQVCKPECMTSMAAKYGIFGTSTKKILKLVNYQHSQAVGILKGKSGMTALIFVMAAFF